MSLQIERMSKMQIDSPDEGRMKVAIIGTSGSGKTCFIAAMRWLGDCGANTRFISVGANGDSKKYLDDLHVKVNVGEVPPGTPKEFKLEFSERYEVSDGKPPVQIDFSMRDFRGGDLHDLDADSPLFQSWANCDLLMVLLDVEKAKKQGVELQDDLRDLSAVLVRNEMDASHKRLAIVITQADKGDFTEEQHSPEDAEMFLEENLHDFFDRIKKCGFKEIKSFLLASIGLEPEKSADGKSRVPEVSGKREWHPFGYEELFDWICAFQNEEASARFWAWFWAKSRPYVVVFAVLALGGVIWRGVVFHKQHIALLKYEGCSSTLEEKAEATWKMGDKDRIAKVEERIRDYNAESEKTSDDAALRSLLSGSKTFREKARISEEQEKRFKEIDIRIADRLEKILFERIKDAMEHEDYDSARELIGQYRKDHEISRKYKEEVKSYDNTLVTDKRLRGKLAIAYYDVGSAENTSRMNEKLIKIREFHYPKEKDKQDALAAVTAMEKLMKGPFEITQIRAEGLTKECRTYVLIATDVCTTKDLKQYRDDGEGDPVETETINSNSPQWNDDRMRKSDLNWRPGQPMRVEWRRNPKAWTDKCLAYFTTSADDWLGFLRVLQPDAKMIRNDDILDEPTITITCSKFPDAKKDLELINRFVIPGTYWTEE